MKNLFLCLILGVLCSTVPMQAQTTVQGNVMEENEAPVPFAHVGLWDELDSTRLLHSGITDLQGNFQLPRVPAGSYRLTISSLGFKSFVDSHFQVLALKERSGVEGRDAGSTLRVRLLSESLQMQAVQVQGRAVRVAADKVVYAVGSADVKGKTQALELIGRIPKLSVDPVEQKIKSHDGKAVKLLINGMNASENALRTLRPEHILRMEHYDIPPARFAAYGSVLNVITKTAEQGWEAGIDLAHAFTTGFGNDMGYLKFNNGRTQWSLDYNLNYRDYSDRVQSYRQTYRFETVDYERSESLKNAFGYDDHQLSLGYVFQDSVHGSLQIKCSPNGMRMHNDGVSEILFGMNDSLTLRNGSQARRSEVFNPVLDVYYSKTLPQGREWIINAVGTAFRTRNRYLNVEKNPQQEVVLQDFMNEKNRKYSLIAEAVYSKKNEVGKGDFGYQVEANRLTSSIDNTFEASDYTTHYQQHQGYAQWTGKWKNLLINGQIGLAYRSSSSASETYSAWILRPRFMVGYEWNGGHTLRWGIKRENHEPGIAQWSSNRVFETDHIIRQGNPYLRHSIENETYLDYTFTREGFSLELIPYFSYTQSPISSYYTLREEAIVYAAENGRYERSYGLQYILSYKPFKTDILQLEAYGRCIKTELSSSFIGKYAHWNTPFSYQIQSRIDHFTLYFMGKIIGKNLDGPYLVSDENGQHLGLKYAKGSWGFSCQAYWIGTASKYNMHTIEKSYVQKDLKTRINDNATMLVFGVSYAWERGKSYQQAQKQLHHRDGDAGMFR